MNQDLKSETIFLARYAATLMGVGCQVTRVLESAARIARSFGCTMNMLVLPRSLSVTMLETESGRSFTFVQHVEDLGNNFRTSTELCELAWKALDRHLTLGELEAQYSEILSRPELSRWTVLLLASISGSCLCRLFDGNFASMAIVFAATALGLFIRQELTARHYNQIGVYALCAFVSSLIGSTDYLFFRGGTEDISLAASVLYLIPGVTLINGVMDIIDHHVLSGAIRLTNTTMLVFSVAVGLTATLMITGVSSEHFTVGAHSNLLLDAAADGAFAAIAGIGFAIVNNPPRRAIACCAGLACIGHAARFLLMHGLGLDTASATACAAFVIGLLAVPLSMWVRCPGENFAFPSLLPMIPGMFAYRAIRDLIQIVHLPDAAGLEYVLKFFQNSTLVALVMLGMVCGCILPLFLFRRQAFSATRAARAG